MSAIIGDGVIPCVQFERVLSGRFVVEEDLNV
jgi:hypothetical protein